jgi:AcrR family transcriptional regulator
VVNDAGPGGSGASREATRRRILDAAEELFAHHGFDATPTARVAKAAGVPKGLLFYYFERKIDLLTALFAERMPVAVPHDVGEVAVPGDVRGSLVALAERLTGASRRSALVSTILWREADTHPEVARRVHAFHDELVDFVRRLVHVADPSVSPDARHAAAVAWAATILMALNSARLGGAEQDLPTVAALIEAGLRGAASGAMAAMDAR